MSEEKVCLTAVQIENIGKAYAKEIEGKDIKAVCPKASKWVKGFFGKKQKKQRKQKDIDDVIEDALTRKVSNKINTWLEGLF